MNTNATECEHEFSQENNTKNDDNVECKTLSTIPERRRDKTDRSQCVETQRTKNDPGRDKPKHFITLY